MDRNQIIIITAAVVVIIIGAALFFARFSAAPPANTQQSVGQAAQTREPVPEDVAVPETSGQSALLPKNVAVPTVVTAAAPAGPASLRIFDMKVSGNQFYPNTVIVYQGDQVNINITAVDANYDFYQPDYGLKSLLPKGQRGGAALQATALGKFTFYCVSCGGPEKGPVGYIIVTPRP